MTNARIAQLPDVDQAVYETLRDAAGLSAMIGTNLFNGPVPPTLADTAFPRVTMRNAAERAAGLQEGSTFEKSASHVKTEIHLWSRLSRSQLFLMYKFIALVLNGVSLTIPGGTETLLGDVTWVMDMDDPDGVTVHAVLTYTVTARSAYA